MANVALALIGGKTVEQQTDGITERFERAGLGAAQQRLELGKHLLNRAKSGLYGGKYRSAAPTASIAVLTPATL